VALEAATSTAMALSMQQTSRRSSPRGRAELPHHQSRSELRALLHCFNPNDPTITVLIVSNLITSDTDHP
jgi:magnesium-transporting ATPase (P-type)